MVLSLVVAIAAPRSPRGLARLEGRERGRRRAALGPPGWPGRALEHRGGVPGSILKMVRRIYWTYWILHRCNETGSFFQGRFRPVQTGSIDS